MAQIETPKIGTYLSLSKMKRNFNNIANQYEESHILAQLGRFLKKAFLKINQNKKKRQERQKMFQFT